MKRQSLLLPKLATLSIAAAFAAPAMAQTAGSNIVSFGWFHFAPQDSSQGIMGQSGVLGNAIQTAGTGQNMHSSVSDADTFGLALTHFFTDNIAVTLDGGKPPTMKLNGRGTLAAFGQLGTAKQWSPALVVKYFFGSANDRFRPFVGLGVTHVWYSDVNLNSPFQSYLATSRTIGTGTATAKLSSSTAPVANIGATYNLDERWSIGFSLSYIPLKTNATITSTATGAYSAFGTNTYTTRLTVNPFVSFLSVGYKF